MTDPDPTSPADRDFSRNVGAQASRKLRARRLPQSFWPRLGMLGLIGWSVCLPTLLGTWLGRWLDERHRGTHSWTLALLVAGLCLGCAQAAHWIAREQGAIRTAEEDL